MSRLSVIVPICKDSHLLDFCMESLADQDFKDFDVCIVRDGTEESIEKRVSGYQTGNRFPFSIEYVGCDARIGASAARNAGFRKMSGSEYTLFLDSDCRMKPGILQNMVDILDKNEDVDFVYGDYEFTNGQKFHSRDFNPYVLRTMNYISTMSMMRTQKFAWFNESLEYFQDWDLFYRMTNLNGSKGYYLKETLFSTEPSGSDNISGIQIPLAEKCKAFRKANGIPDSKLVVSTLGCPVQAEQRAEILGADYAGTASGGQYGVYPSNLKFDNWTHTYMTGVFNFPVKALVNHIQACQGTPILHFVGTDVFQLWDKHSAAALERIRNYLRESNAVVLANSPWLKRTLDKVGIEAEMVYTPLYCPERYRNAGLPDDFTVGVYYSDTQNMNHFNTANPYDNNNGESNLYLIWEVAKALPHIKFRFFGGSARFRTSNVEFCGKIQQDKMPDFIHSCSTIVRSTIHDGNAQLPLQYMLSGRRVVTGVRYGFEGNQNLELGFTDILDYEKCKSEVIDKILECRKLGQLGDKEREEVEKFVYCDMGAEAFRNKIATIMEENK